VKRRYFILAAFAGGEGMERIIETFKLVAEAMAELYSIDEIINDFNPSPHRRSDKQFGNNNKSTELDKESKEYSRSYGINEIFCEDCINAPNNCDKNIEKCIKEAELYFSKFDQI